MSTIYKKISIVSLFLVIMLGVVSLNGSVFAVVPGTNELVSKRSTGALATNDSSAGAISPNGKVVVFYSLATNILPSSGKGIFARNLSTGSIVKVDVSTAGVASDSNNTTVVSVSTTGRYILLSSYASNLIDGTVTSTAKPQLYIRDTVNSTTVLVGQTTAGDIYDGTFIDGVGVSSDGRFVTFITNSSNLNTDSTNGTWHLYRLDRTDGSFSILDRKTDGTVGSSTELRASMSCDGSIIALQYGSNLITSDPDSNHTDIYVLDLRGSTSKLTNLTRTANFSAYGPRISCNGDFIGFKSNANNIDSSVSFTKNGYNKPYIYDRINDTYQVISVTTAGAVIGSVDGCGYSSATGPCMDVSDTGIGVFSTNNSALTGDSGAHVYIRDTKSRTTELLSKNSSGVAANDHASFNTGANPSSISADGRVVVYSSRATNLVSGDTNAHTDIFTSLTGL